MMAVGDGCLSVALEDFYTDEQDTNKDGHGLIVGLGYILKGAVIVADGIPALGELDEGLPLDAGVADELADGADGDDGMTDDGILVAGPADHVGPEVVDQRAGEGGCQHAPVELEGAALLGVVAMRHGRDDGPFGQELLP